MASILDSFKLDGKVALVTGASRGLGAAMARALAEAGADVILMARGDLSATRALVQATGRKVWTFSADQANRASLDRLLAAFGGELPWPDILVNNGGTIRRANFTEFSLTDWDEVIETNLTSIFRLSQRIAREWLAHKRRGKIIHTASMLSFQGGVRVASYTASKSALSGLTKLMANELAAHGINVNAIAPGYMATDNTAQLRADAERNKSILDRIPAARWGESVDLAGAVVYLASPASDYVHGHILAVDGGWLAR
ncbi:MAG TPA: 2-dehydro-3-deoxy-D-gluconate 5-dehydrogenase KduD [Lacunisphaera sp.]|nr:2-dehydro-3-deoxy-D-gluconate 5-dehydrogenase KduD [Lacunisphaera sp.]